ncbi:SDR family NAD(P)-dependent oxidoreductase [Antarctobacter sp.]|uniref:SDR family NAD(P)-dependent oxidoreductase n=1 Tax=Antarctobacter sp. TaxID=1872577 RepID=UPI003A8E8C8D
MKLHGTAGIVTGAASGLGRATAERLAAEGAQLVLMDVNAEGLEKVRATLPGSHIVAAADIRDPGQVRAGVDAGAGAFGALRFVVNCAGIPSAAKTVSGGVAHDLDLWNRVIGINLTGSFNVLRLAVEKMITNDPDGDGQRGVIVNTSSIAAFDGLKGQAAYTASKAAVAGMTLPIARDLADHGIRCVAIAPGVFETELTASVPDKGRAAMERNYLFPRRTGYPSEFADMVLALMSNPYLNGDCFRIDGGTRFAP